jgi:AraC family ethanolamine operon transcriptional activator
MEYQHVLMETCDPEELTTVIDGSYMRHRVLPGGYLRAKVDKLNLSAGVLHRGRYDMGILADGLWPTGLITVGIILDTPDNVAINGLVCPTLSVQLYGEGCELSYRAPPRSTWLAYCVERERIQEATLALNGRPMPIPDDYAVSFQLKENDGRRIAATIQALFTLEVSSAPSRAANVMFRSLEEQFHYDLARSLDEAQHHNRTPAVKHVTQRRVLMQRAEDCLRANISEPFSLQEFAKAVRTSVRMLEYHFRQIYGVTPAAWFRSMKLNAIHRELRQLHGADIRISDIAMRWGFLHLGRFSLEYRRLFGESPSDTLRRT